MSAHLMPPAGVRCYTADRVSDLTTWTVKPSPFAPWRRKTVKTSEWPEAELIAAAASADVSQKKHPPLPQPVPYPQYASTNCPLRPFCMGVPSYQPILALEKRQREPNPDPPDLFSLPYGLPPQSWDVRVRAGPNEWWREEQMKYSGVYRSWEKVFGRRYHYTFSKDDKAGGRKVTASGKSSKHPSALFSISVKSDGSETFS